MEKSQSADHGVETRATNGLSEINQDRQRHHYIVGLRVQVMVSKAVVH